MKRKRKNLHPTAVPSIHTYKPATIRYSRVYYIKLCFADGLTLYKIGYTSMSIVDRVEGYFDKKTGQITAGMGLPRGCVYKIIAILYKGSKSTAYSKEQALHKLYQAERWRGVNRLANGNSELYRWDILGLDKT